jgi:hypothetical protein
LVDVVEALDASIREVEITSLEGSTFYAELHLVRGGDDIIVSARPSDAVALAVRTSCPLYVSESIMNSEGVVMDLSEDDDEVEEEVVVDQFREFLDTIQPEDFSG